MYGNIRLRSWLVKKWDWVKKMNLHPCMLPSAMGEQVYLIIHAKYWSVIEGPLHCKTAMKRQLWHKALSSSRSSYLSNSFEANKHNCKFGRQSFLAHKYAIGSILVHINSTIVIPEDFIQWIKETWHWNLKLLCMIIPPLWSLSASKSYIPYSGWTIFPQCLQVTAACF